MPSHRTIPTADRSSHADPFHQPAVSRADQSATGDGACVNERHTMPNYPTDLTVIDCDFRKVTVNNADQFSRHLVYLRGFALLRARQSETGNLEFNEAIATDLAETGDVSLDLLTNLAEQVDPDSAIGGWQLARLVASLVRLPRDSEREQDGIRPLMRFTAALAQQPLDARWLATGKATIPLHQIAVSRGYSAADWGEREKDALQLNPALVERRLSHRVRSIWVAFAQSLMAVGDDRRRAFAAFDQWESKGKGKGR